MRLLVRITASIFLFSIGLQPIYGQVATPTYDIRSTFRLDRLIYTPVHSDSTLVKSPMYFNADKLPFFCKMEHRVDQKLPFNVRLRLGSVEYVDRLEKKID